MVVFLTSYGTEQENHTNTSKYGVQESTPSIGVLQEINLMIYHIEVIPWNMQLLQELLSIGNHINFFYPQIPSGLVW